MKIKLLSFGFLGMNFCMCMGHHGSRGIETQCHRIWLDSRLGLNSILDQEQFSSLYWNGTYSTNRTAAPRRHQTHSTVYCKLLSVEHRQTSIDTKHVQLSLSMVLSQRIRCECGAARHRNATHRIRCERTFSRVTFHGRHPLTDWMSGVSCCTIQRYGYNHSSRTLT